GSLKTASPHLPSTSTSRLYPSEPPQRHPAFFDIQDRIDNVVTEDDNGQALFTFANVDYSKILGFSWENSVKLNRWQAGLGATYMGEATAVDGSTESDADYLWSFNLQTNLGYSIPSLKTVLSAQLKYTGRTQVLEPSDNGPVVGQTDSFTWMDASVRTSLTKDFDVTLGARNILDVVTVNATDLPTGAHGTSTGSGRLFGNGRSYFLKLSYNLNFN
ncbi:MAG: TonB-dependent receptor, partial [Bacteroidota bacterium]